MDEEVRQIGSHNNSFPAQGRYERVTVFGGGAWGTALAAVAARAGRKVTLWCRREDVAEDIVQNRRNTAYLGDIELPAGIAATTSMEEAGRKCDVVLLVTPSGTIREMSAAIAQHIPETTPVILCAKGIERGTGLLLSEVAQQELGSRIIGVLSGPTFADETALAYPSAVTVASPFDPAEPPQRAVASLTALALGSETFRPYVSNDVVGVEVGGAVKNVIAIACGMMTGAGFAKNTRGALVARGVDEMKRLAEALGGQRETVTGLSGVGDLTLTCSSTSSRNMSLGVQLGEGIPRAECFEGRPVVVEGELNSISVTDIARRFNVEMPICEAVRAVLHDGAPLGDAFARLWSRPLQGEPKALDFVLQHPADETAVQRLADTMS